MRHYRIALIETTTAFGDPVKRYAIQLRVAFFWWVTVEICGSLFQARYCLNESKAPMRKERIIKVIENSTKS